MDTFPLSHRRKHLTPFLLGNVVGLTVVGCSILIALIFTFLTPATKIVRGVSIDGVALAGLNRAQALQTLRRERPEPASRLISVQDGEKLWATSSATLGHTQNYEAAVDQALAIGKSGPLTHWLATRAWLLASPQDLPLVETLDQAKTRSWVDTIALELDQPGTKASLQWNGRQAEIVDGVSGRLLARELLTQTLMMVPKGTIPVAPPIEITAGPLSADGWIRAEQRAKAMTRLSFSLLEKDTDEKPRVVLGPETIVGWLALPDGYDEAAIQGWIHTLAAEFAEPPRNAEWELASDGQTLTTFVPEKPGRQLNENTLKYDLIRALDSQISTSSEDITKSQLLLPLETLEPTVRLRDLNSLGVSELIGAGDSTFYHSIPNRVFNVALTSERVHASLVQPGDEFSFSQVVGDISSKSGYKTAYVIRNGRTELGDGGGVCQVSTTVFRAALNAGLPITAWKAHSYRVGYYEQNSQPGFDATIYSPSVDLRFKNDTKYPIVLASFVDTKELTLRIELWGTSDGRKSELSDYKIYNQRPAPAAVRIPDPSLPSGTVKQIDWAAPGATTKFHYRVTNTDGTIRTERDFVSVFRPWQAIYLYGP